MTEKYIPLYALVFLTSLFVTVILESRLIPFLSSRAKQPIYKEGPDWHLSKTGTPTMGGLAFLIAITLSLSLSSLFLSTVGENGIALSLFLSFAFASLNSVIGILDDLRKLKRKQNRGLSPMEKLLLQFVFALAFLILRRVLLGDLTGIEFSFGRLELGFFYYPICILMLLGIVNCANLTDGIDGLAASVAFCIGASLFYFSAFASYDTALISSAMMGGAIGFLFFNLNPAKIFMGDTGSLFFGALTASCFFTLKNPLISLFVCTVYVLEGASVIIQVAFYKMTKKRVFKMAPLHHHLEKCGMEENKICIIAMILTFLFSIPAYLLYKV